MKSGSTRNDEEPSALAPALLAFRAAHPRMTATVIEGYGSDLIEQLRRGQLDFAIAPFPASGGNGLQSTLFAETPGFLVSSPKSELQHCAPVRLRELKSVRMILPTLHNARRDRLEGYFGTAGVRLAARMELDSILGTMELVRHGAWFTVLPGLFVEPDIASRWFTVNPLVDPILVERMMVVEPARSPINAGGRAFVASLREAAEHVNAVPLRLVRDIAAAESAAPVQGLMSYWPRPPAALQT